MSHNKGNKIQILSFYSGGGFLDMGFEKAGFEVIWTNENDTVFAKLHSAGITSWRKSRGNGVKAEIFNTKSISDVSPREIIKQAFPKGKPKYFGIIGGPPCQDFSQNGNLKGFNGERGKLTIIFIDRILELKPAFFVMENVTGLMRTKSNKEYLKKLLKRLEAEYYIDHDVLNALDFGVPQFRERVFFVGISKKVFKPKDITINLSGKWFPWPVNTEYQNAFARFTWPHLNEFGKVPEKPNEIPEALCIQSCLVTKEQSSEIPNSDEYFKLYVSDRDLRMIQEGETNRPSFKRLHRYRYSPTACYGNNEVHLHPYKNRRLTVREALRIQGVPDSYVLPAELPLTKKFKMIGNGVPVPLAEAVASALKAFLEKNKIIK